MYILKEDIVVDFSNYKSDENAQCQIAEYIGIDKCTLNRILHRKQPCGKTIALIITMLNSEDDDIEQFFERVK